MGIRSCIFLLCAVASGAHAAPRFELEAVPGPAALPGYQLRTIDGFNDRGQILTTSMPDTFGLDSLGLYTPGTGLAAIDPGPAMRIGYDLNERGQVAGVYDLVAHVFGPGGAGGPVPGMFGISSYAYAINDRGMVVGQRDGAGAFWYTPEAGLAFAPRFADRAVDVNDRDVVLLAADAPGQPYWLYDTTNGATTTVDLGDRLGGRAWLNDTGDVAWQEVSDFGGARRVHLWRDGALTGVSGVAGGLVDELLDFNDPGWLLGRSYIEGEDGQGTMAGFLNLPDEGTFALDALIDPASRAGWTTLLPFKLNDAGDIAGWGLYGGEQRLFVLRSVAAPVPEPGALGLFVLGAAAIGLRVRRARPAR